MPLIRTLKISLLILSNLITQAVMAEHATIATAANFSHTMQQLAVAFENESGHQLTQVTASTGVLTNQIRHGAPFDVLLAADDLYPVSLEQSGQGISNKRFTYALGELVLASTRPFAAGEPASRVLRQSVSQGARIAIANPELAPYGRAAQALLTSLDLWQYQRQWVRGNSVSQTFQFVASGAVDAGLVAMAQILASDQTIYYLAIAPADYPAIEQQAILLQSGMDNPAAIAFLEFLKSTTAQDIIRRSGYRLPTSNNDKGVRSD